MNTPQSRLPSIVTKVTSLFQMAHHASMGATNSVVEQFGTRKLRLVLSLSHREWDFHLTAACVASALASLPDDVSEEEHNGIVTQVFRRRVYKDDPSNDLVRTEFQWLFDEWSARDSKAVDDCLSEVESLLDAVPIGKKGEALPVVLGAWVLKNTYASRPALKGLQTSESEELPLARGIGQIAAQFCAYWE